MSYITHMTPKQNINTCAIATKLQDIYLTSSSENQTLQLTNKFCKVASHQQCHTAAA